VLDLESELDRLYRARPHEFVAERTRLVRALKEEGRRAEANEVAKHARPSPIAWAVNQLYYEHADDLARLMAAGSELRAIQQGLGTSEAFTRCKQAHHEALRTATDRALAIAQREGDKADAGTRRRIELTLNELGKLEPGAHGARAGRLAAEVEPAGFDALSGLILPEPSDANAEALARLQAARAAMTESERRTSSLERALRQHEERLERVKRDVEDANRMLEAARRAEDAASAEVMRARAELEEARAEVERRRAEVRDLDSTLH
jgi:chromosome segregation ATPase